MLFPFLSAAGAIVIIIFRPQEITVISHTTHLLPEEGVYYVHTLKFSLDFYLYLLDTCAQFSSKNVNFHPSHKINKKNNNNYKNDSSSSSNSKSRRIYPLIVVFVVIVVGCLKIPPKKTTTNTFSKTKFIHGHANSADIDIGVVVGFWSQHSTLTLPGVF